MFSRPVRGLWKRIGFRLTLWYSAFFILSGLFLFGLAYALLSSSLNRQDHEAIQVRLKELSVLYRSGGMETLKREVTIQKEAEGKTPFFIRLAGRENETIFLQTPYQWTQLDIRRLQGPNHDPGPSWTQVPLNSPRNVMEIASIRLGDHIVLQAGKSSEERERILRHFREGFAAVMIPLFLVGLGGGAFLAFRALHPIRHLIDTIQSIDTGKMDERVPNPGTGDELEDLVVLFNRMVEKIAFLIRGMRGALDNVAHDLRTPMTRLRGMAEVALQSRQNDEACREALSDCLEESDRILKMVDTLMDISEAETGVIRLNLQTTPVIELIEDALELYRYVAEDKNLSMEGHAPRVLSVKVDPMRMRQVLANLLDNALKYTPYGGNVEIQSEDRGNIVAITVRDTGIGIPPDDIPRIWDRLYRGDQSRSEKGLGLGLSLVKAIVSAHGGKVEVASEPGKGSIFTLLLPADKSTSPPGSNTLSEL